MTPSPILAPAAVLALWTFVMLFWMIGTRFVAFGQAKIDLGKAKPGGRGVNLEGVLPDKVNWKAHNYTHLMEQPTVFYAVAGILALAGAGTGMNLYLAWGYTGLRIVHSLWQATVNRIPPRAMLFFLSSACLMMLSISAVRVTLGF
jgi:hypothetical protein